MPLEGGLAVLKKLTLVAICLAYPWAAMAQDAKTVIANAQKALGDVKAITYSGSAKDVSFQQCGANAKAMVCQGTHDPMRPIEMYVRVGDLSAPATRHTGASNNIGAGGSAGAVGRPRRRERSASRSRRGRRTGRRRGHSRSTSTSRRGGS